VCVSKRFSELHALHTKISRAWELQAKRLAPFPPKAFFKNWPSVRQRPVPAARAAASPRPSRVAAAAARSRCALRVTLAGGRWSHRA
jgi:hypothetical protein